MDKVSIMWREKKKKKKRGKKERERECKMNAQGLLFRWTKSAV